MILETQKIFLTIYIQEKGNILLSFGHREQGTCTESLVSDKATFDSHHLDN